MVSESTICIGGSVRTASGSDRIIYHLPFIIAICRASISGYLPMAMKNVKFQMTNDPVATARGSDTTPHRGSRLC